MTDSVITHELQVELTVTRCYDCGRVYAHESNRVWQYKDIVACPNCAQRIKDAHFTKIAELERTVAALKGALTRSKAR